MAEPDDGECAVCGRKWLEQKLGGQAARLKTNAPRNEWCWHQFCTSCIDRLMMRQQRFPCPACGTLVKRATLDSRDRDEIEAERDAVARRRVISVYNKPRSAFETDLEYNDYCETVEELVLDLSRGGDAAKRVEATLKRYQADHSADVARRASEKAEKERLAAIEIKASHALAMASAQRQRDEQRRLKLDRQLREKHKIEYELGDRPDMPPSPPEKSQARLTAHDLPLPTPLESVPDRPKFVYGQDLDKRRLATDWNPDAFRARAASEFLRDLPWGTTGAEIAPDDKKRKQFQTHAAPLYVRKIHVVSAAAT